MLVYSQWLSEILVYWLVQRRTLEVVYKRGVKLCISVHPAWGLARLLIEPDQLTATPVQACTPAAYVASLPPQKLIRHTLSSALMFMLCSCC